MPVKSMGTQTSRMHDAVAITMELQPLLAFRNSTGIYFHDMQARLRIRVTIDLEFDAYVGWLIK